MQSPLSHLSRDLGQSWHEGLPATEAQGPIGTIGKESLKCVEWQEWDGIVAGVGWDSGWSGMGLWLEWDGIVAGVGWDRFKYKWPLPPFSPPSPLGG